MTKLYFKKKQFKLSPPPWKMFKPVSLYKYNNIYPTQLSWNLVSSSINLVSAKLLPLNHLVFKEHLSFHLTFHLKKGNVNFTKVTWKPDPDQ